MMLRTSLILALVAGILASPLLCGAGVTVHECICDSTECCADGKTCEADPCDDLAKETRHQVLTAPNLLETESTGVEAPIAVVTPARISSFSRRNTPFPDSDLPLRI